MNIRTLAIDLSLLVLAASCSGSTPLDSGVDSGSIDVVDAIDAVDTVDSIDAIDVRDTFTLDVPQDVSSAESGSCAVCGSECVWLNSDPANCGSCGSACSGSAACAAGTCVGARPIGPLSGAIGTTRRPMFHWQLAGPATGGRVRVCRDRACTSVIVTADGNVSASPNVDLPHGILFWQVLPMHGAEAGTVPSATWELQVPWRSTPIDAIVGSFLDVNGDGYSDMIVGGPGTSVAVYPGTRLGIGPSPIAHWPTFGMSVADATDVNGDGYSDIMVGTGTSVVVYFGGPAGPSASPDVTLLGGLATQLFGRTLAGVGDTDGDGFGDVVVSSPALTASISAGRAFVYRGGPAGPAASPTVTLVSTDTADSFGASVAAAGDVNGDGYADVWVGAPDTRYGHGSASLFFGSARGVPMAPATVLRGGTTGIGMGMTVAGAHDVNGDGYADVIVGSAHATSVYLGGASGIGSAPVTTLADGVASGPWGAAAVGIGDVDGDGFSDVAIGGPSATYGAGLLLVFRGSSAGVGSAPLADWAGASGTGLGTAASAIGDVNADGFDDFAVSAPMGPGFAPSHVDIFLGSTSGPPTSPSEVLSAPTAGFGLALAMGGPVSRRAWEPLRCSAHRAR